MFEILPNIRRVVFICGRTDMRRGIDGLSTIVRLHYGLNPLEIGSMFLFCGTKKDRIKGLIFVSNGALGEAISADYFRHFCLSDCAA